ncbi:MAG: MutS-related protein [Bacteroidia bacterium]
MKNKPINFYEARIKSLEIEQKKHKVKSNKLVSVRLILAIATIAVSILLYKIGLFFVLLALVIVSIGVFIWLVKNHNTVKQQLLRISNLIEINRNEINALNGDFTSFDNGNEYIEFDHKNLYDLDLFGDKSLYQRVNRATTSEGQTHLANHLKQQQGNNIESLKLIHSELGQNPIWRQDYLSVGMLAPKNKGYQDLVKWFAEPSILFGNKFFEIISKISPIGFVAVLLLYFVGIMPQMVPIIYFFANLVLTGNKVKVINALHGKVSKKQNNLDAYAGLLQSLTQADFKNNELIDLKNRADGGFTAITELKRLINLLDSRLNMIMGVVLNGMFLWDFRLVIRIEKWKIDNVQKLEDWIEVIAQTESHCSLSNYVFNNPELIWPTVSTEQVIAAKAIGHPFLLSEERVCNDFELDSKGQVVLLSGANMSGKSTFLRTIGLNLVMAKVGLPVCAKSFSFKPIPIFTSMRINDSLQESESYFFAELKRLKFIMDTIKRGEEIFILMDEILRGTNSNDKHKGSAGLIKQLISLKTSGIVASHDITLSALENEFPNKLLNRSFEVENKDGELVFDYKLRDGVCQNLNATYLMEKMGIV